MAIVPGAWLGRRRKIPENPWGVKGYPIYLVFNTKIYYGNIYRKVPSIRNSKIKKFGPRHSLPTKPLLETRLRNRGGRSNRPRGTRLAVGAPCTADGCARWCTLPRGLERHWRGPWAIPPRGKRDRSRSPLAPSSVEMGRHLDKDW